MLGGMRRLGVTLLAALLSMGACAPESEAPRELTREHEAAIRDSVQALLVLYAERVERGDWEGLAELYADDPRFTWVEDGEVRYDSTEEARASLRDVGRTFSSARTEFVSPEITPLAPGLAQVTTGFRQSFERDDGEGFEFAGAMTATVVGDASGWRFLTGHTSTKRTRVP